MSKFDVGYCATRTAASPVAINLQLPEMRNTAMQAMRDHIHRQLEQAGVKVAELGGGAIRLQGHHESLVLTSDLLNLRVNEINRLVGGAVWL